MKKFSSIGHFFATIGHGIVTAAKAVAKAAPVVGAEAAKLEPIVEGVTSALDPAAVPLERIAFQLLGNAVATVGQAQSVADAKGMNLPLDLELIAALKALGPQFEALAAAFGVAKPTNVPVTAPVTK